MAGIDDLIASEAKAPGTADIDGLISQEGGATPASAASGPGAAATPPAAGQSPGFLETIGAGLGHGFGSGVLGAQQLVGQGLQAAGRGLQDVGANTVGNVVGNDVGKWLTNDANTGLNKINAEYSPYAAARPYTAGASNLVGGAAAAAPAAMIAPGGALLGGALSGAAGSAMQPVDPNAADYWSQKAQQAGAGAAGGGLMGGVAGGVSRMLNPQVDPAIAALMAKGVEATPGMIAGGGANRFEQALTSMPFIGSKIAAARSRAIGQFNTAAYNDVLAPLGQTMPADMAPGGAAIQHLDDTTGAAYNNLEGQAQFNYDGQFHRELTGLRQGLISNGAPQSTVDQFDNIVKGNITNKMDPNTGELTGPQWGQTRTDLNSIVRNNTMGANPVNPLLGNTVDQLNDAVSANVARNSPASVQGDLSAANQAYSQFKRVQKAAGYTGARNSGNVFTPAQYSQAVGSSATAAQKATNSGVGGQFAQQAQALASKVPDSGTPERAGAIGALLALPHVIAHPGIIPAALGANALYSPTGVRMMGRLMTQRPQMLQQLGGAVGAGINPAAGATGALSGGLLGQPDDQQ